MNCKEGEIAICVQSQAGNVGKVCTVHRLMAKGEVIISECGTKRIFNNDVPGHETWITDTPFNWGDGGVYKIMKDKLLRPIRDQPGEDETLTWAPVPHKEMV